MFGLRLGMKAVTDIIEAKVHTWKGRDWLIEESNRMLWGWRCLDLGFGLCVLDTMSLLRFSGSTGQSSI